MANPLEGWEPTEEQIEAMKPAAAIIKPKFAAFPPEVVASITEHGKSEEGRAAALARFTAHDVDGDGLLNKAEYTAYWQDASATMKEKFGHAIEMTEEECGIAWDGANKFTPEAAGLNQLDLAKMRMVARKINAQ